MKRMKIMSILLAVVFVLTSGCVWQSDFDDHVKANNENLAQARMKDEILLCESRVDAYQDLVGGDEADPTRRDEPEGTRRDLAACQAEFNAVAGEHVEECQESMEKCPATFSAQECRNCYKLCLSSGTWPTTGLVKCPLP